MSGTIICHGCGAAFPLPEGHVRNKVQCAACGVICPVPAEAQARAARPSKAPAKQKSAAARASLGPFAAEPPPPVEKQRPAPDFNPFDTEPPEVQKRPPPPEMLFGCRRCGRKVRRQGECPNCDGAPEIVPGVSKLELTAPESEEQEGTPYLMADKDLPTCPKCRKQMTEGAVLCLACGLNQQTRKKTTREYQPLARSWETNMPLGRRLFWWGVLVAMVLAIGALSAALASMKVIGFLISWVVFGALLAFLLGTFEKINLTRDSKGRVTITKTWRIGFVAVAPNRTEVFGFEGVVSGQWADGGFWEWFIFLTLFPMGIVPAIVWWYHILRTSAFHVALARDHGRPAVYVYRGRRQDQMRDVADTLCDASGLRKVD